MTKMKRSEIKVGDQLTWMHRWGPDTVEVLDIRKGWTMAGTAPAPVFVADEPGWNGILVRVIATGYTKVVAAHKLEI